MKNITYTPNLSNLKIIKDKDEQHRKFFQEGHPYFLIPDFNPQPADIWLSFLDFLEKEFDVEIWDQNGGEVYDKKIIDDKTGLTKCIYNAYEIQISEDSEPEDWMVQIVGYVVENQNNESYFVATEVKINPAKHVITYDEFM